MQVVPGPRVNVRRIAFKGNSRTSDEVIRREMRQFEGAWYSQAAIDRSKIRLQQLGYFETVDVETVPVAGSNDEVDVVYNLKETTSGSFVFGLGFSQLSGLTAQVQLSQTNFLGSGNQVSVQAQRNDYQQRYDFSFRNPYFTDSGLSLGYNLWWRELDYSDFNTAQYSTNSGAFQAVFGLPITETDTVTAMLGIDTNEILVFPGSTPHEHRRLRQRAQPEHLPRLARGNRLGPQLARQLPDPDPRHAAARLAGNHPARLDRRVLQAQLQHLQVLAAVAPFRAQHARRTGLRRQLRRRRPRATCAARRATTAACRAMPTSSAPSPPTACRSSRTSTPVACARCAASPTTRWVRATCRSRAARSISRSAARSRRSARWKCTSRPCSTPRPRASRRSSTSATSSRTTTPSMRRNCASPAVSR